jgi:oligosaccharide repeat unit polymerase
LLSPYYNGDYRFWVSNGVVHLPYSLKGLSLPLVYITGSFPTLSAHLDQLMSSNDYGYGYYTFRPIVSVINIFFNEIKIPDTHSEFYYVGRDLYFNVYTYLRPFIDDFGFFGGIIGPFFQGLLTNWFYVQLIYRKKY